MNIRIIKKLNEKLDKLLNEQVLNEMAKLNNVIEVNNEDTTNSKGEKQEKFPHFHWVYNHKIHFNFSNRLPKNVTELRKLIVKFPNEQKQISNTELKQVLQELNKEVFSGRFKGKIVFEAAKTLWKNLHPGRDFGNDLVIL